MKKNRQTSPVRDQRHRLARWSVAAVFASLAAAQPAAQAATQYFAGDGSALNAAKYSSSPSGPFTSAFTSGSVLGFSVVNGTGLAPTGAITIGGITATQNFTETTGSSTLSATSVITVNVASGFTVDLNASQGFISSSATGGYSLTGGGTFATAGNSFGGGVTLGGGSTLVARGTNALGSTATNTLTIYSGILGSSKTNDYTGKIAGGITIGGDFQLGILSANSPVNGQGTALVASDSYNQTFSNNISLGTATARTITLGNKGNQTLGGVISGNSGLTFAAVSGAESTVSGNGTIAITGTSNTFTGAININGPEVTFGGDGSMGNTANTINIDGGRFTVTATSTITASRGIQLGGTAGTSISAKGGTTVVTYNGVIADKAGSTGTVAKQGSGTLALGGVSTYGGDTSINNGTLQLTTANNRLPTGTTVNIGQASSTNVGAFDLGGYNQTVAGLNSVSGTNTGTSNSGSNTNTVTTSTGASTLTLGGTGTYAYGDGTTQNTGAITGAVSIVKSGSGTQTFGGANTYTGTTSISAGTLLLSTGSINSSPTVALTSAGALTLQNTTALSDSGNLSLVHGTALNLNASGGTETVGSLTLDGNAVAPGTYMASDLTAMDGAITFTSGFGETLTVVPEPATVVGSLLMVGALGWNLRRRARRLPV